MNKITAFGLSVLVCWITTASALADPEKTPQEVFAASVNKLVGLLEPGTNAASTLSGRIVVAGGEGFAKTLEGNGAEIAFQAPDRLRISAEVGKRTYMLGRNGQELWAYAPQKKFGVVGKPGQPRFASAPDKLDHTRMEPLQLPIPREQFAILPLLAKVELIAIQTNAQTRVFHIKAQPLPETRKALRLLPFTIEAKVRESDWLPQYIHYNDGKGFSIGLEFVDLKVGAPWAAEKWNLPSRPEDRIETTALGHLTKFVETALGSLGDKPKALGPVTGERRVVD